MLDIIFLFILFVCWGSFLNVVAYRTTYDKPFFTKRSYCPSCQHTIFWYDNIPIISWFLLKGKCRFCKNSISILYPFIEVLSGIIFTLLFFNLFDGSYNILFFKQFFNFLIFFSALIVATRTDFQEMVIPQLFSLWLMPVGFLTAFLGFSRITFFESLLGGFVGYGVLWSIGTIFEFFTKREGVGQGDMELLGMIGAFLGPIGVWFSLMLGSISGFVIGVSYILITKKDRYAKIPFGPFLALGAVLHFFLQGQIPF